jgi:hypothetical protein
VEATPAWDAVLKAGEWPLVLVRRDTNRNVAYVYVGTDLSPGQTTWPLDVSFPLFFARLAEAMRGGGTFGDVEEWTAEDLPVAAGEPARAVPLSPWALGAAAGVVALAAAGLIARGGARR